MHRVLLYGIAPGNQFYMEMNNRKNKRANNRRTSREEDKRKGIKFTSSS